MAKSAKKAKPKPKALSPAPVTPPPPPPPANPATLTTAGLVAAEAPHSQQVNVTFTFTSGIGQATAVLFRKGVLINMQSISSSGVIPFSEVQAGDVISVNGVCTGSATVALNATTVPANPKNFNTGLIMANFLIK